MIFDESCQGSIDDNESVDFASVKLTKWQGGYLVELSWKLLGNSRCQRCCMASHLGCLRVSKPGYTSTARPWSSLVRQLILEIDNNSAAAWVIMLVFPGRSPLDQHSTKVSVLSGWILHAGFHFRVIYTMEP